MKIALFIVGGIVLIIIIFIVLLFVNVKGVVVNALPKGSAPEEFRSYQPLSDSMSSSEYQVSQLKGKLFGTVTDDAGNLVVITKYGGIEPDYYYHRISPNGVLLDTFKSPDDVLLPLNRLLLSSNAYCDWIITGDTTVHPLLPSGKPMSKEQLLPYYKRATIARFFESDSLCIFQLEGQLQAIPLSFGYDNYTDRDMPNKGEKWQELERFNKQLWFYSCPETIGNIELRYFQKTKYVSSAPMSGFGSPTGGGKGDRWYGDGYYALKLMNGAQVLFTHITEMYNESDYSHNFMLAEIEGLSILYDDYNSYLISPK